MPDRTLIVRRGYGTGPLRCGVLLETERLRLHACSVELAIALVAGRAGRWSGLLAAELPEGWPDASSRRFFPAMRGARRRAGAPRGWGPGSSSRATASPARPGSSGSPVEGSVEIGYGVAQEARGRGVATEAAQALVARALRSPSRTRRRGGRAGQRGLVPRPGEGRAASGRQREGPRAVVARVLRRRLSHLLRGRASSSRSRRPMTLEVAATMRAAETARPLSKETH